MTSDVPTRIAARQLERAVAAGFHDWPEGWTVSDLGYCRSCHAEILWCITPRDARAPVDRDGKSHFASCPNAADWRKR